MLNSAPYFCISCHEGLLIWADKDAIWVCPNCSSRFEVCSGIPVFLGKEILKDPIYQKELIDWEKNAVFYHSEILSPLYQLIHRKKLTFFGRQILTKPGRLLDLGCGTGSFSEAIGAAFPEHEVIATDFSLSMCSLAHNKSNIRSVCCSSAAQLPFQDQLFDGIFLNGALHHFKAQEQWPKIQVEIDRILKPGGRLYVYDRHDSILGRTLHHLALFLRFLLKKVSDIATSASDHEPDFSINDLDNYKKWHYQVVDRSFAANGVHFALVCSCNLIQYTLGFRLAQFFRWLVLPVVWCARILDLSPLCVEQLLVLEKPNVQIATKAYQDNNV